MPSHATNLAAQVEQDPRFVQAAAGLKYALVGANEDGATTGTVNGKPFYAPPKTNLVFYADGSVAPVYCPLDPSFNLKAIVGVLWVHVPQNADASYNLSGMTTYHTAGLLLKALRLEGESQSYC